MEMTQARKSTSKYANSPSSSTTSSSKQFPEASVNDNLSSPASSSIPLSVERSKENVTVTVRFRPLSPREIRRGEEIAWYADGETILRNEETPSIAYAYDRVFGPTTTTRHVYDIAAQHVVSSAMEGVNGTIFAYGVTSSGKTHTMHGDQRSPGIIPFAVKDVFSIIQETPNREFLLRVSYLEIYNEVVNDLLNPAGQNLRIREESQGAFVEGITEEVVLSPAHVLSLIAAGEEHRHVGSTNYNLLSSRSHTIFTLTIESSPCGENGGDGTVSFSQLNLVDLAGSESSKAETTGVHRKEGSYINKSLLSLGTVISKLTDGKSSHIPYRDSKLTRLLQSSLSGHGRVSLICTVTPSSSNSEETHNTLKFAHRAKYIEIQAAQNKIIDEKSLIKKYQNEIRSLKEELEQLKGGVITVPQLKHGGGDELAKQKLEDGEVELQSRLGQEEEDAKEALLSRIQRLTKLILVSNKSSHASRFSHRPLRRGHSFGEEEVRLHQPLPLFSFF
ncbi:putative plus-end-directed kinesin ATPase [Helianthus debilis subsp. tardiflorus]